MKNLKSIVQETELSLFYNTKWTFFGSIRNCQTIFGKATI